QVELVGHVVEIAQRVGLGGEMLGPLPFLQQLLGEGIAVGPALRIEARAGIAVPVPGAADVGAGLEDLYAEPEAAQPMELLEACGAGADDNDGRPRAIP